MGGYAWVTLATNDAYSLGALVLAHSLRRVGTKYELACMVTPGVTATMREKLAAVFSLVQEVNVLDSKDEANLALLARPELGITFTKLHCWRLTQYEKCVFVDADTLVVRNCDELFEREELSAAPDVGWPDCFNSGVFVFRPSQQTFASITAFAATKGSFDGGDQGLLNMYFSDWATKDISKHLPFIYNMCSTATYSYLPAFKQFGEDVRIIHFIGITKPWLQYFDTLTGIVQPPPGSGHLQPLLQLWWNIFCERVHPQLSASMMGIAGALAQLTLGEARSAEQIAFEEHMRKQSWEQGQIDYMGRDSFDNIWKKICETLSLAPQRQPTPPKEDTVESKESTAAVEPTVKTAAPVDVEVNKPAVEAPAQSVVCKVPEEKLSTAQTESVVTDARTLEQEAAALPSKESITVEAAATKVSSESGQPAATEDVCTKSPIELKDVKSCETSTEVPPPKPLVESLPTETITEQCKLASPPATQEVVCQDKSETEEPQQADSQAFTSLLAETVCKKETSTAVSSMPVTAKPEVPASAIQAATLHTSPISVDSPQTVAASLLQSKTPVEDATKCVIESIADVMQPLTIDPSEQRAEMLLAASEVSTMSPVPIQVAESVLQAEPKESVSGAVMVVGDQAIATTVTTVQDSTAVAPTSPIQLNGSACEIEARGAIPTDVVVIPDLSQKTDTLVEAKELAKEALSEVKPVTEEKIKFSSSVMLPEISSAKVKELPKPAEPIARTETAETKPSKPAEQIAKTETPETKPAEQIAKTETAEAKLAEQIAKEEMAKEKPAEQIAKTETIKEKPVEEVAKAKTTEAIAKQPEIVTKAEMTEEKLAEQVKVEAAIAKSPSAVPKSPIAEPSPSTEVLIEAKAMNIPSTPTVIEATPPTTPSVESAQEAEEKAAKKKKSDSPESVDGESADKKAAKKTMKKVTKKPKAKPEEPTLAATEGAAAAAPADNSQSKTKKTVKVTKKTGLKTGQTLETETNVPETPPPPSPASTASPDVPVPPKRKTKNSSASAKGSSGKKPEAEE